MTVHATYANGRHVKFDLNYIHFNIKCLDYPCVELLQPTSFVIVFYINKKIRVVKNAFHRIKLRNSFLYDCSILSKRTHHTYVACIPLHAYI